MLEVEDWTQPTPQNKRRVSSRKLLSDTEANTSSLADSASALPPAPPDAEVEDTFRVTHPPNSHLFPSRPRVNSSPPVRPSSLSRLLAQAPPDAQLEAIQTRTPSPTTSPPPPPSPLHNTGSVPNQTSNISSPLRPGSRASRISTTSRFSVGRIPIIGSASSTSPGVVKAAATTALSEQPLVSSPSSGEGNFFQRPTTPSPEGSISEGLVNLMQNRRRTMSHYGHPSRASPLAASASQASNSDNVSTATPGFIAGSVRTSTATSTLANLASSWGVSFGRRKKADLAELSTTLESPSAAAEQTADSSASAASELLKRF